MFVQPWTLYAQKSEDQNTDSVVISKITEEFYEWYLFSIQDFYNTDYKPLFIKSENGFVTLDFSKYLGLLDSLHFSTSLIKKERESYNNCLENLKGIKYSDFKSNFTDLDQFEETQCDFSNYFRWIGGQEPIEGIHVIRIDFKNENIAIVNIDYFYIDSKNEKQFYEGNVLEFIKSKNEWKINKINSSSY